MWVINRVGNIRRCCVRIVAGRNRADVWVAYNTAVFVSCVSLQECRREETR
jgi:hypothetical protein